MTVNKTIRVRMYDVGFGDCFLITLSGDPKRSIVIDAGFHSQGKGQFNGHELAQQVIADVEEAVGKKRVDVLIATHRHQDHITAFNADEWDGLEVGEVWMPWVEDPENTVARKLWKKNQAFAQLLAAALPGFPLDDVARREVEFLLWNAGAIPNPAGFGAAFAAWSNAAALERLHGGFARRDLQTPRFLPVGTGFPETFQTDALPGVRVHVLGPPRDPDFIANLDPERDGESYRALALRGREAVLGGRIASPFADIWFADDAHQTPPALSFEDIESLRDLARSLDPLFAARALDNMINATSLVFVLEVGSARLLFPGDAEWGTWKLILDEPRARSLLKRTTFLKVGHHGSHNATPKTLVEEILPPHVKGMISTQEGDGQYRNHVPLPALLEALKAHGVSGVRSDDHESELPVGYERANGAQWIDLTLTA